MGQRVLWLRYYYIHSCFIPCTHSLCGLSWNWSLATYLATSYVSAVLSPCKTNSQLHLLRGSLDKCITDQFHKQSIFLQPFCSSTAGDDTRHWNYTPMYQMEDGIGIGKLSGKNFCIDQEKTYAEKSTLAVLVISQKVVKNQWYYKNRTKKTWYNTEPNINLVRGVLLLPFARLFPRDLDCIIGGCSSIFSCCSS